MSKFYKILASLLFICFSQISLAHNGIPSQGELFYYDLFFILLGIMSGFLCENWLDKKYQIKAFLYPFFFSFLLICINYFNEKDPGLEIILFINTFTVFFLLIYTTFFFITKILLKHQKIIAKNKK